MVLRLVLLLLYALAFIASQVSYAVVRYQRSARDESHGQAARLWLGLCCWPTSRVGATGGTASYGVVRFDAVGGCGQVAEFAIRLCTNVGHTIFDDNKVKGYAPTLEHRISMFSIIDMSWSTRRVR